MGEPGGARGARAPPGRSALLCAFPPAGAGAGAAGKGWVGPGPLPGEEGRDGEEGVLRSLRPLGPRGCV